MDSDELNELYSNDEFLKEDMVIEELVLHSEDLIIKIQRFSDKTMFWRVKNSIPELNAATNIWLNEDILNAQNRNWNEGLIKILKLNKYDL